jgi:monofunctional glycosyltransferase
MVKRLAIVAIIAAMAVVAALRSVIAESVVAESVMAELPSRTMLRAGISGRIPPAAVRTWKPLWHISPRLRASVIAWEDPRFYHHSGISPRYVLDALLVDIREWRYARGGSTITQQLAKNLFLTGEKTVARKLRDMVLARRLEDALTKDEILEVYLNTADWGDGVPGVEAAARFYFETTSDRLDWSQSAALAAMLPNPRLFDPCRDRLGAERRRDRVLDAAARQGALTANEQSSAKALRLIVRCSGAAQVNAGPGL